MCVWGEGVVKKFIAFLFEYFHLQYEHHLLLFFNVLLLIEGFGLGKFFRVLWREVSVKIVYIPVYLHVKISGSF